MRSFNHLAALLAAAAFPAAAVADGVIVNEDNTHFFAFAKPGADRQVLIDHIDRYLVPGHQISEFFLNPGSWTFSIKGKHLQAAWKNMRFEADGSVIFNGKALDPALANRFKVMKQLDDAGINPYKVWIDRLR